MRIAIKKKDKLFWMRLGLYVIAGIGTIGIFIPIVPFYWIEPIKGFVLKHIIAYAFVYFIIMVGIAIEAYINSPTTQSQNKEPNFEEQLEEKGFKISKKLEFGSAVLYVDTENKMWTMRGSSLQKIKRYRFNQLVNFEIFEDGATVAEGKSGSAFVGGLLAGTTGAIIGGAGGKKIKDNVTVLQLQLIVDDLDDPSITLDLLSGVTTKGSWVYKTYREQAHKFIATLTYIKQHA